MARTKDRLDFRIDHDIKQRIEQAASLTGQTVTSFAVSALVRETNAVLANHENVVLNAEASREFLERLDKDIKPNRNLRRAAERHREMLQ